MGFDRLLTASIPGLAAISSLWHKYHIWSKRTTCGSYNALIALMKTMKIPRSYVSPTPILSAGAVAVLAGLNRDYLDLLIVGWRDGLDLLGTPVMRELGTAPPAILDSIAACSYSLFAFDFASTQGAVDPPAPQVHDPVTQRYSVGPWEVGAWPAFTTTALFFAWHLSCNSPLSARVMLGLSATDADTIAALEPWQLRHLAGRQPAPLRPRWSGNPCFWPDLVRFADNQHPLRLALARLLGVQLLAADLQAPPHGSARRRGT